MIGGIAATATRAGAAGYLLPALIAGGRRGGLGSRCRTAMPVRLIRHEESLRFGTGYDSQFHPASEWSLGNGTDRRRSQQQAAN